MLSDAPHPADHGLRRSSRGARVRGEQENIGAETDDGSVVVDRGPRATTRIQPGTGDLDRDGNGDIVAAGNDTGEFPSGYYGLFWFRGDGKGGWQLVRESGPPASGMPVPYSVTLADLDRDRTPEIISLKGGVSGSITIWKSPPSPSRPVTVEFGFSPR